MDYTLNRHFPPPRTARGGASPAPTIERETTAETIHTDLLTARTKLCHKHDYPDQRDRPPLDDALITDRFTTVETTGGYLTVADTLDLIISFSGKPNRIEVSAEDHDAVIQCRRDLLASAQSVTIRAGQTWDADVTTRHIWAANNVAGLAAKLQVIGRY